MFMGESMHLISLNIDVVNLFMNAQSIRFFSQSCGAVRPVGQPRLSLLCPKSLESPVISIWFYLQHWHPQPNDHWRLKGEHFGKPYVQFGELTAYTRLQRPQWYGLHILRPKTEGMKYTVYTLFFSLARPFAVFGNDPRAYRQLPFGCVRNMGCLSTHKLMTIE